MIYVCLHQDQQMPLLPPCTAAAKTVSRTKAEDNITEIEMLE